MKMMLRKAIVVMLVFSFIVMAGLIISRNWISNDLEDDRIEIAEEFRKLSEQF